jgi:polysaccharide deacetylase family protein (PEP-CTERM system associated)
MAAQASRSTAILTVDYEDWFHVKDSLLGGPGTWSSHRLTVEEDTRRLLDVLDEHGARATFFVVGWLAPRTGGTLREIVARGHRLGLHGYDHVPPDEMSQSAFRDDIRRCQDAVHDATGVIPLGYRAPFFGVQKCSYRYLEVLSSCGLIYDCSIFTGVCPGRERARCSRDGRPECGLPAGFEEFAIPSVRVLGLPIAFSGGGFLRFLPLWFVRWSAARTASNGSPIVYYMHPRDINPAGPIVATSRLRQLRYYGGRRDLLVKIRGILSANRMVSVEDYLEGSEKVRSRAGVRERAPAPTVPAPLGEPAPGHAAAPPHWHTHR